MKSQKSIVIYILCGRNINMFWETFFQKTQIYLAIAADKLNRR